ncbi:hypothetical protein ACFO0N_16240 [Halobium salinum]|uniref:Uncharacterized protein n=1 Tax=Halobium salinum TaxID=1364940 RepID=A0ABD5PFI9_9EURY|nr:hypothetical protein [Halobium salinum]
MSRSALHAVALAALLLTAGCGGLFGDAGPSPGADDPTTSGTVETTTGTTSNATVSDAGATTADESGRLPPGVTERSVEEPLALSNAHARSLSNASYTVDATWTVRSAGDESPSAVVYRSSNAGRIVNESRYNLSFAVSGSEADAYWMGSASTSFYADGERVVQRTTRNGTTSYGLVTDPAGETDVASPGQLSGWDPTANDRLYSVFSAVDTMLVGTETEASGDETLARIEGSGVTNPDLLAGNPNVTDPRNATLSATVGSEGRVRSLRVAYDATWAGGQRDGEPVRVEWTLDYSDYGETTVDRPAWYDRAVDAGAVYGDGGRNGSGENASATTTTTRPVNVTATATETGE